MLMLICRLLSVTVYDDAFLAARGLVVPFVITVTYLKSAPPLTHRFAVRPLPKAEGGPADGTFIWHSGPGEDLVIRYRTYEMHDQVIVRAVSPKSPKPKCADPETVWSLTCFSIIELFKSRFPLVKSSLKEKQGSYEPGGSLLLARSAIGT
jgi:hypothetical protein